MGLADVLVQGSDVVATSMEVFVGSGMLQHAGNGAQDVALFRLQSRAGRTVHHVEAVRGHDGRVHVAVVDQVTDDLRGVGQTRRYWFNSGHGVRATWF